MKDPEDNSFIGTYKQKQEQLHHSMSLRPMSKNFIQLNVALEE